MKPKQWMTDGKDNENDEGTYVLRLFITGASPNSVRAVDNLKAFCEKHLKDKYRLEIIDVHQQPAIAQKEQIIALPLLIKKSPAPKRRLIGDLSDTEKLMDCFRITV